MTKKSEKQESVAGFFVAVVVKLLFCNLVLLREGGKHKTGHWYTDYTVDVYVHYFFLFLHSG